jgi:hypothetical protein
MIFGKSFPASTLHALNLCQFGGVDSVYYCIPRKLYCFRYECYGAPLTVYLSKIFYRSPPPRTHEFYQHKLGVFSYELEGGILGGMPCDNRSEYTQKVAIKISVNYLVLLRVGVSDLSCVGPLMLS